jgi:hypothetical protein
MSKPEMLLWLSDNRGQYIPRDFAASFMDRAHSVAGVDGETWAILEAGPDHEFYWDAWADVCSNAIVTDENGDKYTIWQEGDCWLVPAGMEWDDKEGTFVWPGEKEET